MFSKLQSHTALSKIRLYIFQTVLTIITRNFNLYFKYIIYRSFFQNFPNRPFHIFKFSCFEIIKLRRKMRFAKKRKKKFPNFNTDTRLRIRVWERAVMDRMKDDERNEKRGGEKADHRAVFASSIRARVAHVRWVLPGRDKGRISVFPAAKGNARRLSLVETCREHILGRKYTSSLSRLR